MRVACYGTKALMVIGALLLVICGVTASSASSTRSAGNGGAYVLQYSANQVQQNAENNVAMLRKKGYQAFSQQRDIKDKGLLHCVYVGRFRTKAQAARAAAALKMAKPYIILPAAVLAATTVPPTSPESPASVAAYAGEAQKNDPPPEKAVAPESQREGPAEAPVKETTPVPAPPPSTAAVPAATVEQKTTPPSETPFAVGSKRESPAQTVVAESATTSASTASALSPSSPEGPSVREQREAEGMFKASPPVRPEQPPFSVAAHYRVMYIDMSRRINNANFAGTGVLHGPYLGVGWGGWSLMLSFLTTNEISGEERSTFLSSGMGYLRKEVLQRRDYEALLSRTIPTGWRWLSVEGQAGFTYTDINESKSTFYQNDGNVFTLTGHMRIYGPLAGLRLTVPLGNPDTTPFKANLSGLMMYLVAQGNHDQFAPPTGAPFNAATEGRNFTASGWGGRVDFSIDWRIVAGLQATVGARVQSASLRDDGPNNVTMRTSNGYVGTYGELGYIW
ncbi:MAG: SPOR domain-containing protein [Syntrophales bacterium]|nr:SPOR domain-containing protein [Syntrophales bacterium]